MTIIRLARPSGLVAALLLAAAVASPGSLADSPDSSFSPGRRFAEQTGEALYTNVCQACHMRQAQGAVGAGRYPALARDTNLKASGYPISVVLHGQKDMPPFGGMMSDDQIAAVVNYLRTHFGNDYKDAVTAQDVKDAR